MANQSMTISFVTVGDSVSLQVVMDDVMNKQENSDRTSNFIFGDEAYFMVFPTPVTGVTIACYQSDGIINPYGQKTIDVEDQLIFTQPPLAAGGVIEDNVASLSKPAYSDFIATGIPAGSSPSGSVSLSATDPSKALASQANPGVYESTYKSLYHSFSLKKDNVPVGWDTTKPYPIVVVVVGS